ncbi:MAG TPA: class III extradiol ring-cleavage dioxygenase [Candidatus Bathyarchaeia archaeon]|nr:class III extradiol ring-cleavage dioxygenase [Candidatus Bathyarchaeia archaeon]
MTTSLFLAHGSPMLVIEDHAYTQFLKQLAASMPRPKAIVIFTAHWESPVQLISGASAYETIYDFYGFPDELYQVTYPAKGEPALAKKIQHLFADAGIPSEIDLERGLDHGAWSVLKLLYPEADIPVIALSVNPSLSNEQQYKIGKALASLRNEEVLIIGSGGTVHNLRRINWDGGQAESWAVQFDDWFQEKLTVWDTQQVFDYERLAPHAQAAVPRNEHFIPLLLAMGTADETRKAQLLHRSYQLGTLSLSGWQFA